jgi:hypothetical protein
MLRKLKNWLTKRTREASSPAPVSVRESSPAAAPAKGPARTDVPRPDPEFVDAGNDLSGEIETVGPGKNVLIRNKFLREETGTHESLKILDDSIVESGEETGIDPYNTGGFDRSRNWDKRFGK